MKILAVDSSGMTASVALMEDELLIAEYTVNYKKTHSQTLLPMLEEIKHMTELDLHSIDAIAVAAGPGSFTGLRIGSATVKGLARGLDKPIVPVPTVDGIAANLYGTDKLVCPLMDARRNQTYTGLYDFMWEDGICRMRTLKQQCAVPLADIIDDVNHLAREVVFLGDGVPVFREQIQREMKVPYSFAPGFCNRQRASLIAWIGMQLFSQGKVCTPGNHAPEYLRLSQAERERKKMEEEHGLC